MKHLIALLALALPLAAADAPKASNTVCPISGKPVNPSITYTYEDVTYAFAEDACRTKFISARENSLYHKLGGKPAIDAAIDAFYVKVLADKRVNHFFEDVSMVKQHRKQKEFLSAAFGGPIPWTGKDMREAHRDMPDLNDTHFNAIAEHLQSTLQDLKVDKALIDQVMAIAESTRADVLYHSKAAKR